MLEYINHVMENDYLQKNTINCPNCRHSYKITSLMRDNEFYPYKCNSEVNIKKNLKFLLIYYEKNKNNSTREEKQNQIIKLVSIFKKKQGKLLLNSNIELKLVVEQKLKEFYYQDNIKSIYKMYRDIFKKRI